MIFQSFQFLVFLLVVLTLVRCVFTKNNEAKKSILLFASYYFYMCWDWRFIGLIVFITAINFVCGRQLDRENTDKGKKIWLFISIAASLGMLAYFKYANFFIESFITLLGSMGMNVSSPVINIILPVGISFYTFQSISYTLDIYRGRTKAISSFRDFALFVAFFPQLVAGPIVRASHFLPQLNGQHEEEKNSIQNGFALILRGLIKKVVFADVLAVHIVDPAFANPSAYSPAFLLLAIYAYSYQVYMDFSGYTDIARGVAKTLGYDLQINFNRPYKATSVSNFWQRWHISMSSFFKDYLYFGLGGSKYGNVYVNLFITFVAIGIWHGAGWNFVAYGVLHASMVCFERWRRTQRKKRGQSEPEFTGLSWVLRVFLIFNFVAFSRLLFRGGSIGDAVNYSSAMLNFTSNNFPVSAVALAIFVVAIIAHYLPNRWTFDWKTLYCRLPFYMQGALMLAVIFMVVIFGTGEAPFIYFQF